MLETFHAPPSFTSSYVTRSRVPEAEVSRPDSVAVSFFTERLQKVESVFSRKPGWRPTKASKAGRDIRAWALPLRRA